MANLFSVRASNRSLAQVRHESLLSEGVRFLERGFQDDIGECPVKMSRFRTTSFSIPRV
jgi:hypothetical protein